MLPTTIADAVAHFGLAALRAPQAALIEASVAGSDVFGILPTGAGKSVCYQIPGIVTGARTLVVSPLIALIDDQVLELLRLGIRAFSLHSNMTEAARAEVYAYYAQVRNEPSFLYISPELLVTAAFQERLATAGLNRLAVDEAHCVSTWGDGFRPDYQRIKVVVRRLRIPHCAAFTATTDPKIERDIVARIPLRPGFVRVALNPLRENLALQVMPIGKENDTPQLRAIRRRRRVVRLLDHPAFAGPTIVYFSRRSRCVAMYSQIAGMRAFLSRTGYTPHLFHARLPYEDKVAALQGFKTQPRPVMFATSAFGMGINRLNVRQIIHADTPFCLIDYAQQIGRGGRDGLPALCTTFYCPFDNPEAEAIRIKVGVPQIDFVERVHASIIRMRARLPEAERERFNIRTYLVRMLAAAKAKQSFRQTSTYSTRLTHSLALLQQVGAIQEDGGGLTIYKLTPGGTLHQQLGELTQMRERMLLREARRVAEFFGTPTATQERLWEILSAD